MSQRTNIEYLRNDQYHDGHNLNARIELHRRFSTNQDNWFRWVFDRLEIFSATNILELGSGSGMLWKHNLDRIPPESHIYLSDFSPGMLHEACLNNIESQNPLFYTALDAQAIPFPSTSVDLVVANHMLYHIPDRPMAFSEIHRVLKPRARLVAATNGISHMWEIHQLLLRLDPVLAESTDHAWGVSEFTIENGAPQLAHWFTNIQIVPFLGSLEVTEAEALLAYILSMNAAPRIIITKQKVNALRQYIELEIANHGSFHISKSTALFIAEKS